ncbi:MAG: NDP-sugar synthase [Verrucomicrobiota bacterium]
MSSSPAAFVLAAGLGTRLAPLTNILPKPLVPVFHKPLLTFALDSLIAAGVGSLAINTHHLPEAFTPVFGAGPHYRQRSLSLFHEPHLLDTGGGIRNARPAMGESTFFLYNGDILGDLPLAELLSTHRSSGALATLLLRPAEGGGVANVNFDKTSGRVLDLRGVLGKNHDEMTVYSGIAVFEPGIFDWIPNEGPYSIIDALLQAMRSGEEIRGLLVRDGLWIDLGTPSAYLEAHHLLANPVNRLGYLADAEWPLMIHPKAVVESGTRLEGMVSIGPGAVVRSGAVLKDSVIWPGSVIGSEARLDGCIVSGRDFVTGEHTGGVL